MAFPTETVYGLGADATNSRAVEKIFLAKGRPPTNPLIVHIAGVAQARRYAKAWPTTAQRLADAFWPGPLTLVVPRAPSICPEVSAGLDTVGLRCPRHPLALELLTRFDGAVAAPSANRSNRISPTTAQHVADDLGDRVDLILDGGPCDVGIESTVITLCQAVPTILRPGGVDAEAIRKIIGSVQVKEQTLGIQTASVSPGQHLRHYSPQAPCYRFEADQAELRDRYIASLGERSVILLAIGNEVARPSVQTIQMPDDPEAYARHLYAALHSADANSPAAILLEMPPDLPRWMAIRDRMRRAARPLEY